VVVVVFRGTIWLQKLDAAGNNESAFIIGVTDGWMQTSNTGFGGSCRPLIASPTTTGDALAWKAASIGI
jgi:hypothetical protein